MPKRPKYKRLTLKEKERRAHISEGLKNYWRDVRYQSKSLNLSLKSVRAKFNKTRDINREGIHKFLHAKKLPAGKHKQYNIAITARDTKGKMHRTIIRGIGAKNSRALKIEVERLTKVWLRANGLVMAKYRPRFKGKYVRFLREMRLIVKGVN